MLSHAKKSNGTLCESHRPTDGLPQVSSSAVMYSLNIQWMKILHVWYMQTPSSLPSWWSLFHQLSWPFWSRTVESITMTMRGMMGEEKRGTEEWRGGGVRGGVKSVQLSHEDGDFWRPLRAVGDLLKFVKGDGEQQGNYHFISVNLMPAFLCWGVRIPASLPSSSCSSLWCSGPLNFTSIKNRCADHLHSWNKPNFNT